MTVTPTWFGPSDRPLLGWLHTPPEAEAVGGVVICPPLGKEQISAYPALRLLADRLAQSNIVAFRFDYEGTGDSSGDLSGPSKVDGWLANIAAAVDFLRDGGVERIALVGLRMGATLAAAARMRCGQLTALVCWDPCESGAGFLREQRALYRLSVGDSGNAESADGSVEAPGIVYGRATSDALKSIMFDVASVGTMLDGSASQQCPVLLLTRNDRSIPQGDSSRLRDVHLVGVTGQPELLDVPSFDAKIPEQTIDYVADYISERLRLDCVDRFTPRFESRRSAVVGVRDDGTQIVETLEWFGEQRLFGIVTRPVGGVAPPLLCLNVATEHHVGPARLWVDLARRLALAGGTTVRFDYAGVGDSVSEGARGTDRRTYTADAWRGALEVARALSPSTPGNVAYIGLCSGAWAAARAGIENPPRAIYLINQGIWQLTPTPVGGADLAIGDSAIAAPLASRRTARRRVRDGIKRVLPFWVFRALGQVGLLQSPHTLLRPLVRAGGSVTLILGEADGAAFDRQRGQTSARILARRYPLRVLRIAAVDHSLLRRAGREVVVAELLRQVAADLTDPGREACRTATTAH